MLGRLEVLQDVLVCQGDVQIKTIGRVICAIDFIWRQSQLGHPQELIIQESALKL